MFQIAIGGRRSSLGDLFPGLDDRDRLGIVVRHPCGAVGASGVIMAAVTAFYDRQRARGGDFFVYPDYYVFHVGALHGDHSMLDIWPSHKEVLVADTAEEILRAINDRGVTRLLVPDGEPVAPALEPETLASARARIRSCLVYSPSGRARHADVRVVANAVTERYVGAVLDPDGLLTTLDQESRYAKAVAARRGEVPAETRALLRASRRDLLEHGAPVETYRRVALDEALALLPGPARLPAPEP
jgi:hypothetical protein